MHLDLSSLNHAATPPSAQDVVHIALTPEFFQQGDGIGLAPYLFAPELTLGVPVTYPPNSNPRLPLSCPSPHRLASCHVPSSDAQDRSSITKNITDSQRRGLPREEKIYCINYFQLLRLVGPEGFEPPTKGL